MPLVLSDLFECSVEAATSKVLTRMSTGTMSTSMSLSQWRERTVPRDTPRNTPFRPDVEFTQPGLGSCHAPVTGGRNIQILLKFSKPLYIKDCYNFKLVFYSIYDLIEQHKEWSLSCNTDQLDIHYSYCSCSTAGRH